jgi:DNA polymerase I-like protein with 3'-5' exonuclease and polymerase domains
MLETFKGEVEILLQVHDSLVIQYPIEKAEYYRTACKEAMEIALPYKQPLIIPADIKVSTISYGDCKKLK